MALLQMEERDEIERQLRVQVEKCIVSLEVPHIFRVRYFEKKRTEAKRAFFTIDTTWQFTLNNDDIHRIEKATDSEFAFVTPRGSDEPGLTVYFNLRRGI